MSSGSTFSKLEPSAPEDDTTRAPISEREVSSKVDTVVAPSKLTTSTLCHGEPLADDGITVLFTSEALTQIADHTTSKLTVEVGGVMLGHVRHRVDGLTVEILANIPAETNDQGPAHFTFTAESWSSIHRVKDDRYKELQIVGWYHSHPDLGAFYSQDDVTVHSAAFVLPWHVSLVADPVRREVCLVGWRKVERNHRGQELAPIPGFYEVFNRDEQIPFDWEFVPLQAWSLPAHTSAFQGVKGTVYTPSSNWPSLPAISPWWGVVIGSLSLLLSLILLVDRLITSGG